MFLALLHAYKNTFTTKTPLSHYLRVVTYAWALGFIATALYFGKAAQLMDVIVGQIVGCYLLVGSVRRYLRALSPCEARARGCGHEALRS